MDIEKAKIVVRKLKDVNNRNSIGKAIETVLSELFKLQARADRLTVKLEKKEAIINKMSIYINSPLRIPEEKYCEFYNSDDDCCWKTDKECKDCIKEYFTKKVEKEGIKE